MRQVENAVNNACTDWESAQSESGPDAADIAAVALAEVGSSAWLGGALAAGSSILAPAAAVGGAAVLLYNIFSGGGPDAGEACRELQNAVGAALASKDCWKLVCKSSAR